MKVSKYDQPLVSVLRIAVDKVKSGKGDEKNSANVTWYEWLENFTNGMEDMVAEECESVIEMPKK